MERHFIHRAVDRWQAMQFALRITDESHAIVNVRLCSLSAIYDLKVAQLHVWENQAEFKRQMSLSVVTRNTYICPYLCVFSQTEFCICESLCVCLKVEFFFAKHIVFICKTLDFFINIGTKLAPHCASYWWRDLLQVMLWRTNFDSVDYSEVLNQKGSRDEKASVHSSYRGPSAQVRWSHDHLTAGV